jgi:hypothetical protein
MFREPFSQGSAAPRASWRKRFIAVTFAVCSVAWSRSLRIRLAWTVEITASAMTSAAMVAPAATPSLCRPAIFRSRYIVLVFRAVIGSPSR